MACVSNLASALCFPGAPDAIISDPACTPALALLAVVFGTLKTVAGFRKVGRGEGGTKERGREEEREKGQRGEISRQDDENQTNEGPICFGNASVFRFEYLNSNLRRSTNPPESMGSISDRDVLVLASCLTSELPPPSLSFGRVPCLDLSLTFLLPPSPALPLPPFHWQGHLGRRYL